MNFSVIDKDIEKIISVLKNQFEVLAGKSILITGANGFLPAYLVDTIRILNKSVLKNNQAKLYCMTIESKDACKRIAHVLSEPYVEHIQQDVGKPFHIDFHVDYIIHAASKASPRQYLADPIGTIDANVNGTRQLLDYAVLNNIESFLFFSSGEIYGDPDKKNIPTTENFLGNSDWLSRRSCYTESKRFAETLCLNFFYKHNVPVKIVRPFHIYGPGLSLNDGRVIADFFNDALTGKDINILSDGLASRAFCYISDATIAFWKVLLQGKNGQAYNVGNSQEQTTIKNLAKVISEIFENKIKFSVLESQEHFYLSESPNISCPSVEKLKKELNYEPDVLLKDGLVKLKNWYEAKNVNC